ncbi:MAG: DUF2268 domain-containing putative Zn-dependent protease [Saonia sp.]
MRFILFLLTVLVFLSCKSQIESQQFCDLLDIGAIGYQCDSLRSIGEHSKAAQLYFKTGEKNQSSELFVYSAWQFSEANNVYSALIAIKRAIDFGMSNPYVLDKVGIDEQNKDSSLRKEVDQLLEDIKLKNSSVDNFEVITTPIDRFWTYYNQAINDSLNAKKHLTGFICDGSNATKDYYHIRYENIENMYRVMIKNNSKYYQYTKNHITSDKLKKISNESKEMMVRFSEIYPNAVFPKTYLIPDLINGSGTLTELGLFIGVTMFAKSDTMPTENLNDWQKNTITEFNNMKFDLVHELMHFQQSYGDSDNRNLLLGKLIEEGVCDFLVTLLTKNNEMSPVMQKRLNYINNPENMRFMMNELKKDLYSSDLSKWMYNGGGIKDRPSNLGYTMGYLICKSYYENSKDKKKAIFELLNTNNFKKIIEESDYIEIL